MEHLHDKSNVLAVAGPGISLTGVMITRRTLVRASIGAGGGILYAALARAVISSSPAIQIFPGITAQSSGVGQVPINPPAIRQTKTVTLNHTGGRWFVCSSATGTSAAAVDDRLRFTFTDASGKVQTPGDFVYSAQALSVEITQWLSAGANTVSVSLVDAQGPNWGCSEVWLVNADSDPTSGSGNDGCLPIPGVQGKIEFTFPAKAEVANCLLWTLKIAAFVEGHQCAGVTVQPTASLAGFTNAIEVKQGSGHFDIGFNGRTVEYTADSTWKPDWPRFAPEWNVGLRGEGFHADFKYSNPIGLGDISAGKEYDNQFDIQIKKVAAFARDVVFALVIVAAIAIAVATFGVDVAIAAVLTAITNALKLFASSNGLLNFS